MTVSIELQMEQMGQRAKKAARVLSAAAPAAKTQALRALAALLIERQPDILKANALDVDAAKAENMDAPRLDRLTLTPRIMADMADACLHVADMADEVGVIEQQWQRPNGLMIGIIMTALPEPESTKKFKIVTKTKRSRIVNAGPLPSSIWPM